MALTEFQRTVCRIIARNRIAGGESYVAGGTALNAATAAARISRDIDLFHDTAEAVASSWEADRRLLEDQRRGLEKWLRENPVQAPVPGEEPDRAASPAQTAPDPAAETRRQFEGELARVEGVLRQASPGAKDISIADALPL